MANLIDMSGARNGRLVVISRAPNKGSQAAWHCDCDCGGKIITTTAQLRSASRRLASEKGIQSCGCLRKERAHEAATRHGYAQRGSVDRLYKLWLSIKNRCYNVNARDYRNYGGRGIVMSPAWRDSFPSFVGDLLSSIGDRPSEAYSLDRVQNDRGYEPGNLRWATRTTQTNNRRTVSTLQVRVDRLEEENARLRQVLRTNGYDMDAVQAIMDSIKPPKEIE